NGNCPVPLDQGGKPVRFFMMTTHTYQQGVHTFVKDGTATLFSSAGWSQPGATLWGAPFYSFKNTTLGYQCQYQNSHAYTIMAGDNPTTDEMCMSINFYVPADRAHQNHYYRDSATFF